jgi:hypothetical protein
MSVVVVRTNKLCGACIYLPAIDLDDRAERRCAIEANDLCIVCWTSQQTKCHFETSMELIEKVMAISPSHRNQP